MQKWSCVRGEYKMEPRICALFVFELNDECKINETTLMIEEVIRLLSAAVYLQPAWIAGIETLFVSMKRWLCFPAHPTKMAAITRVETWNIIDGGLLAVLDVFVALCCLAG